MAIGYEYYFLAAVATAFADEASRQGGDWGALVADVMATQAPPELLGIHSNMPGRVPPDVDKALQTCSPLRSDLSADERCA